MKNTVALFAIVVCGSLHAQTPEKNLMKYWKHRDQLNRFVYKGDNIDPTSVKGSYLVAEYINLSIYNT